MSGFNFDCGSELSFGFGRWLGGVGEKGLRALSGSSRHAHGLGEGAGGNGGDGGGGVGFPDRRCPNPLAMKMNQQPI